MSQLAIRFSNFKWAALAICATAFLAVPVFTPAEAAPGTRHAHVKKHTRHWRHAGPRYVDPQRPLVAPYRRSDWVCPGIGRSFECKIWPPPFEDDPDRKVSKH